MQEGILPNVVKIVQAAILSKNADLITQPLTKRRVLDDDRLCAFGAGGDEADGDADLFGKEVDVATSIRGEGTQLGRAEC
jgi:hypothetical protein